MMVVTAIGSGLSFGADAKAVMTTLCFFRFWLGFGIGGDYPLSATIMSEYANQKTRGAFIASVFAMQGVGIVFAGLVSMAVSKCFWMAFPADEFNNERVHSTRRQADYVWRIILMFGALPALLTYYWRMKMPETARFTALVAGNAKQAAIDMGKVLHAELQAQPQKVKAAESYKLFSNEFLRRHGLKLLGTSSTWFLLDIAFYSNNLTQKDLFTSTGLLPRADKMNAIEEVYRVAKAQFLLALFATVPGYWFTVFLIDRIGRFLIQQMGFLMMSAFMLILGVQYDKLRADPCETAKSGFCGGNPTVFAVLYALTFFFANFGPNTTTFVVPAELFPARLRSTCHGISAAAGKAGAILSAFVIQKYTQNPNKARNIEISLKILAAVNFLGFLFTFLVPETKGRSLEEISGEDKEMVEPVQNSNSTVPSPPLQDGDLE